MEDKMVDSLDVENIGGDFNYPDKGIAPEKKTFTLNYGHPNTPDRLDNLVFDPAIIKAAEIFASEVREILKKEGKKPEDVAVFQHAAGLDGDPSTLTDKELGAHFLATSMAGNVAGDFYTAPLDSTANLTVTFDNQIDEHDLAVAKARPEIVAALAKHVFGDNSGDKNSITLSDDANKQLASALTFSPDTKGMQIRC
jgi:hypothetical protein